MMNTSYNNIIGVLWGRAVKVQFFSFLIAFLTLFAFPGAAFAQHEITVTGQVTDENGDSLPGATVVVEGTEIGTTTNIDGIFTIEVTQDAMLVFSYVGYEMQQINVEGRERIDVQLEMAIGDLEELVVVGYGTQQKINLTGSVATVSSDQIENRPIASLEESLQGTVSGLNMIRTSGQPGNQGIDLRIRGTSTFTNNPALIVIDGIPSAGNRLDRLNPNDIASISVLKDAASASIYGSRATGGVILITTKTGQSGRPQINYNNIVSMQSPTRFAKKVSALDHALLSNEARENDGGPPKFSEQDIQRFSSSDWSDHDWDDYMLRNALQTNHNVSVSGGSDSYNYYLSFGYLKQDGIIMNSDFARFNVQLNQSIDISDYLTIRFKGAYAPSTRVAPVDLRNLLLFVAEQAQTDAFKTSDGRWLINSTATGGFNPAGNALARGSKDGGQQILESSDLSGNISIDFEVLPNIMLTGIYGLNQIQSRQQTFERRITLFQHNNPDQIASQSSDNFLDINNSSSIHQNISLLANYTNTIRNHNFTILGGVTAEWFERRNEFIGTRDFLTDDIFVVSAGTQNQNLWNISGGAADWALASLISRANYSYKDKYLLEANLRYDGSSRFAEDLRWGLFPSVSAGWILSEENFFSNNNVISFLKLRASWGQVGNQNVGFYPFVNNLSESAYYFNGTPQRAVGTAGAANPLLKWETKEAVNLGIEGSIFGNILDFNIDVFHEKTKDILLQLPLPTTFGQIEPVQNAGRVDNKGWEIELQHRNSFGNFSYGVSFQVSDATNTVVDIGGISPRIINNTITEVGHSMNEWYGIRAVGNLHDKSETSFFHSDQEVEDHAFQNPRTSPGDLKFVDVNNDGVINSDDRVRLGRTDPRYPFGVTINLFYKNFDFKVFGQGVMSNLVWSGGHTAVNFTQEAATLRMYHLDRWTPDNPDAQFPKTRFGTGANMEGVNDQFSSFWLEDASYFRLKNIQLGYNLSEKLLQRFNLRDARVFISGENLFTFTNYLGYDPEVAIGTDSRLAVETRYPLPKVLSAGININF